MTALASTPLIVPPNQIVQPPGMVTGGLLEKAALLCQMTSAAFEQTLISTPWEVPFTNNAGTISHFRSIPPHPVNGAYGMPQADVLVVGKAPNAEELQWSRMHSATRGQMWKAVLDDERVHYGDWILANVCWWFNDAKKTPAKDFKEWSHFLALTINAVRPKYILCFGSDAMREIWNLVDPTFAKGLKFKDTRGAVLDYPGGIKVMAGVAPANVLADPTCGGDFLQDIKAFGNLTKGVTHAASQRKYTILEIDHQAQLDQLVTDLIARGYTRFAVDCEGILRGQLRTIQFSWSSSEGAIVILRRAGMVPAFSPSINSAFEPLWRLFKRPNVTITGHNFRGDLKWLMEYGLDLTEEFINGGIDTMLAYHELDEVGEKQLEIVAFRMLAMPRYDLDLRKWLADQGYQKVDYAELGYGEVPDNILHPYAVMDAIATFALAEILETKLKLWPGLWEHYLKCVHVTNLPLMEMEQTGVLIDLDRVRDMADLTSVKTEELICKLRKKFNWPEFNPGSSSQVAELLFSMPPIKDGKRQFKSPTDAIRFTLTPIKATDKTKGLVWEKVVQQPLEEQVKHSPSTDQESVAILAADCPALNEFRQFKTVDQLRKNFLQKEITDEDSGDLNFEKGIGSWIDNDGRLRTSFRQTLETGRYATSPNLQNWPKKQEKEIAKCFLLDDVFVLTKDDANDLKTYWTGDSWSKSRIDAFRFSKPVAADQAKQLGCSVTQLVDPRYYPIRTCIVASPGTVLVEPDWNQAELWTLGSLARDDDFLHVLATSDLHTVMLQKMFGSMDYKGQQLGSITVEQLNKLRKVDKYLDALRTCAKTVNFGIPYQRGAAAIVREIKKEGVRDRTNQEAQGWIDTFYNTFQKVAQFLQTCKDQVINPRYMFNPFCRYRRFPWTNDRNLIADYQREAVNFPIQSTVGDSMSLALVNFWTYRRYINKNTQYRLLLSIHDAVLMEVPIAHLECVVDKVIPACMVSGVEVPNFGLHYGIGEIDIQLRWGEKADPDVLYDMGVPRHLCGFKEKKTAA